jgi:hypothetical protein
MIINNMLQFEQNVTLKAMIYILLVHLLFSVLTGLAVPSSVFKVTATLFGLGLPFILPMFFFRLKTKITAGEIHFRMVPFHWKEKVIKAENIAKLDLQTGNFYRKFLGFGIKYNGEGWAYFLANEKMLHITLRNGEQIWLGLPSQADLSSIQQTLDFNHE